MTMTSKSVEKSLAVFCKTCWKDVDALIIKSTEKQKPAPLRSTISVLAYAISSRVEMLKLILLRLIIYLIIFIEFEGTTNLCICNPYVLVLLSTSSLILLHLIAAVMPQFLISSLLKKLYMARLIVFGVLPLAVFEVLLLNANPMFVIIDLALGLMLLTSIKKRLKAQQ